jgi:hypothetical protein
MRDVASISENFRDWITFLGARDPISSFMSRWSSSTVRFRCGFSRTSARNFSESSEMSGS